MLTAKRLAIGNHADVDVTLESVFKVHTKLLLPSPKFNVAPPTCPRNGAGSHAGDGGGGDRSGAADADSTVSLSPSNAGYGGGGDRSGAADADSTVGLSPSGAM